MGENDWKVGDEVARSNVALVIVHDAGWGYFCVVVGKWVNGKYEYMLRRPIVLSGQEIVGFMTGDCLAAAEVLGVVQKEMF